MTLGARASGGLAWLLGRRQGEPGWAAEPCQWEAGIGPPWGWGLYVSLQGAMGWGQRDPSPSKVSAPFFPFRLRGLRVSRAWEKPTIEWTVCFLRAQPLTPVVAEVQRGQSPCSGCTAQRGFFRCPAACLGPAEAWPGFKKRRVARASRFPGELESGRGCGAESFCFFLLPGRLDVGFGLLPELA